jgi:hypothetical protein
LTKSGFLIILVMTTGPRKGEEVILAMDRFDGTRPGMKPNWPRGYGREARRDATTASPVEPASRLGSDAACFHPAPARRRKTGSCTGVAEGAADRPPKGADGGGELSPDDGYRFLGRVAFFVELLRGL